MNKTNKINIALCCRLFGYSRQAYYKQCIFSNHTCDVKSILKKEVLKARIKCPGKGCREIYYEIADKLPIGRDQAIRLMLEMKLGVKEKSKYQRTTESGKRVFDNLLAEITVTRLNQVWQADMSYFKVGSKTYYLIFITDVYSQHILGYGAFKRAYSEHFVEVLHQAIDLRLSYGDCLKSLIHHSDGGKQYESHLYQKVCSKYNITQSMCYYSWENPYAEKTNDLVKNRYLKYWSPKSFNELEYLLSKAVMDHNENQKKGALNRHSPLDFENRIRGREEKHVPYRLKLKPKRPRTKNKIITFIKRRNKCDNQIQD